MCICVRAGRERTCGVMSLNSDIGVIILSSIQFLSKKIIKLIFKKKHWNRFKPTGSVILEQKPKTKPIGSVFFDLAQFCLVWLGFFPLWLDY